MNPLVCMLALTLLSAGLSAQSPAPVSAPAPTPPPKMFAVRLTKGPAWDEAKSPNDQAGMREHSANIARIRREGLLVLGARFGELGLLVLRLPDEAAVQAQLAADPAIASGVFKAQVDVFSPFAHGSTAYLTTPEAVLLRAYLDAHNRHDAGAVTALCAENAAWYNVVDERVMTHAQGREAIRKWRADWYAKRPSERAEFLSIEQNGPFLMVRERATWDNEDGSRVAEQVFSIYETSNSLIQRAWHYPGVRTALPPTR